MNFRMSDNMNEFRYGVATVASQAFAAPGPLPRRGPTPTTSAGPFDSVREVRDRDQRLHSTDKDSTDRMLNILQWNAEGVRGKKEALSYYLKTHKVDVACIQETHLKEEARFSIRGYQTYRKDRKSGHKGGALTLVKNSIPAIEMEVDSGDQSEIQSIKITGETDLVIHNCYCPPLKQLNLEVMSIPPEGTVVLGDFNSRSPSWGYPDLDARGEEVENWQIENNLLLLNHPDDPPTFYSRRWRTTTTPDLGFATDDVAKLTTRKISDQLAGSDHRPVLFSINLNPKRARSYIPPRWNFKRANWVKFSHVLDLQVASINSKSHWIDQSVKQFGEAIKEAAQQSIPRGSRKDYTPYWSEELQTLHDEVTAARSEVERNPTVENNITLKAKTAKFRKETISATRKSWHEKTSDLNFDKDGKKLWKITRALNGENCNQAAVVLQENEKQLTQKEAANHLVTKFSEISDIPINPERDRSLRQEQRQHRRQVGEPADDVMTSPFTLEELNSSIDDLQEKKAPGPDNIPNDMLKHLGPAAKKKLLSIYNTSWQKGIIPKSWKKATMIPILKPGKPPNKADSYRPISLTSCLCKLMERMVNRRLIWYLESNKLLIDAQSGFRQCRSTEDQLAYISQEIEDGFQDQKHTVAIWVDMAKAFDKVWKAGILTKLLEAKVSHNMLKWIEQYLKHRKGRVSLQGRQSREADFKHGVPQGGVLSPTLFILFMNSITEVLDSRVKAAIYADDLAILSTESELGTAQVRLQTCLNRLEEWTNNWAMTVNATKTTYTIFSLSPKPRDVKLKLGDTALRKEDNPRYLGVVFDPRLTWHKQLEEIQKKGLRRTAFMKKLSGTAWGANMSVLKKAYVGYVRPAIEYGVATWGNAARSTFQKAEKVQNQCLRIITRGMKSTPINEMEAVSGLHSMEDRKDQKIVTQFAKFQQLKAHPMHDRVKKRGKSRLKRSNFSSIARTLNKSLDIPSLDPSRTMEATNACPPWKRHEFPQIRTEVEGISRKSTLHRSAQRCLVQDLLQNSYPTDEWVRAYTDGSAKDATKEGGAGIYIEWPDGTTHSSSIPTGLHSSNYKAEAEALQEAASILYNKQDTYSSRIVLLTDAKSVLQSLANPKATDLNQLVTSLTSLNMSAHEVVLQWIPGHCDLFGNDAADELAKQGSDLEQIHYGFTYHEAKTTVKAAINRRWKIQHPQHRPKDPVYSLSRQDQVIILRLRNGHNRLRHHMYRRFKIGESAACPCGAARQDASHILQDCELYCDLREEIWGSGAPLWVKLHGSRRDLEMTAAYIRGTSLDV